MKLSVFSVCVAALAAGVSPASAAATADPGERSFLFCYSCHSVNPAETDLPGPNLFGVVGRPVAAQAGFKYSDGLTAFARDNPIWTPELIERFIQDPTGVAPGTRMEPPPGVDKPAVRKVILEYLAKKR